MQLFYAPELQGEHYLLNEEESKHCTRVLRLGAGDHIFLTDGKGNLYEGSIDTSDKGKISVHISGIVKEYQKRNYRLHVAIAPTKSIDRFEWFLEKATEIGIDVITPLITDHSERKKIRLDRLEKIVIAAMKQSVKAYKPIVNPLVRFSEFIKEKHDEDEMFIAHCHKKERFDLKDVYHAGKNCTVLIGPEGDFSEREIDVAIANNFKPVTLGDSRLRTETAGIVACHTICLLNH
jgi:16S rRNA (uracil1498-N3)-methyltransferase